MTKVCINDVACCGTLDRPRYFAGQLVTADTLSQEQDYFRQRLRLHNRMLHGWGTVCGTEVCRVPMEGGGWEPWLVRIKPGHLLGPYGDDIVIDCEVVVDLRTAGTDGAAGVPPEQSAADPWCSRVCLPRDPGPLYLAVRYKECATRPVKVQPAGCGCESEACEYSVLRDGYEIGFLDECPDSHRDPTRTGPLSETGIPECPPCPDSPWVVLACIELDGNGIVDGPDNPDNCSCRRIVVSHAWSWSQCPVPEPPPPDEREIRVERVEVVSADGEVMTLPATVAAGDRVGLRVAGAGFGPAPVLTLQSGFELTGEPTLEARDVLRAGVAVLDGVTPGSYGFELSRADGASRLVERVFEVERAVRPVPPGRINEIRFRRPDNGVFATSELSPGDVVIAEISADALAAETRLEAPAGFEVSEVRIESDKLVATLKVPEDVAPGAYALRLLSADGELLAEREEAFTIRERGGDG